MILVYLSTKAMMKKKPNMEPRRPSRYFFLFVFLILGGWVSNVLLMPTGETWASEDRKTIRIIAHIRPRASLTLSHTQITFDGQDDQSVITAMEGPVQVTAKGRASSSQPLTLTARAESDLMGTNGNIPIQQVQWKAKGEGLRSGTLTRTSDQLVGQWTKSGVNQGKLDFSLKNTGNSQAGDFSSSFTLTLTSP